MQGRLPQSVTLDYSFNSDVTPVLYAYFVLLNLNRAFSGLGDDYISGGGGRARGAAD